MSLAFRNEIHITALLSAGAVAGVTILLRSRRPLTQLFAGKRASLLLPVLPRLFSLCTLIGSFDPCVGFNLSFREAGHA